MNEYSPEQVKEMEWAIAWAATQLQAPLWYPSDAALANDNSRRANHLRNLSRFRRIYWYIERSAKHEAR